MNCKPGDLAVTHGMTVTPEANGYVVEVIRWVDSGEKYGAGEFDWLSDTCGGWLVGCKSGIPVRATNGRLFIDQRRVVKDKFLRPIRDPGDDAVDESLSWLPSPSRTKEEA